MVQIADAGFDELFRSGGGVGWRGTEGRVEGWGGRGGGVGRQVESGGVGSGGDQVGVEG